MTETVAVQEEEKNNSPQVKPSTIKSLINSTPRPHLLIIENVVILAAALFLPLFNMFYTIQGITILLPLTGRVLGVFPWLIALAAIINVGINLYGLKLWKTLINNKDHYIKKPRKALDHLNIMEVNVVFSEIVVVFMFFLMLMLYYSYIINYQRTLADPIAFLPEEVWRFQLGFSEKPTAYTWNLRFAYGFYVLIGTAVITSIHTLINFIKARSIAKKLSRYITSGQLVPTIPKEIEGEEEEILVYEDIEVPEEEEEISPTPSGVETAPVQSQASTTTSLTTTASRTQPTTRFARTFTPPQLHPCNNCRTEIPLSAKFCYECGAPAAAS